MHNLLSLFVMYMTFPYGLPGDIPKKYNLNTQILSFLMPSNYQHLSEGFICFVCACVCVYACVNMCFHVQYTVGLVLSCVTVHVGVSVSFSYGWLCSAGFSKGLLCLVLFFHS